ncbi:DNA polymerase I [Pseudomonadota bacterium]
MPNQTEKPFILVDGSSYLFRAFHAIRHLSNAKGQPTNAIYGVTNMIRKLITEYQPELMAVIFDAKGKTFRNDMYEEYKAHRPPMPDELRSQIEPIHNIVRAMGIPMLVIEGVEADDVIGTLCRQASAQKINTLVSTGDKDMAQLVDEHVTLINTMTDTLMTPETVEEKFGVPPELIIDYLALMGDTADNIPGVPKCGPKTAVKWLKEFGSLDEVVINAEKVKGKVGENLRNSLEFLPIARQLTTIKCDVELEHAPSELKLDSPDTAALRELFQEMNFNTWLKQLKNNEVKDSSDGASTTSKTPDTKQQEESPQAEYETVLTQEQLDTWIEKLNTAELFAFDTETTSLDYMEAEIVGVSFSVEAGKGAYVPVAHDYEDAPTQLSREKVLSILTPLLEDASKIKVGQNLKYDMSVLANYGIHMQGIGFDTMLESYSHNSTASRHNMDALALVYLGHETIHYEDIAGKGVKQVTFNKIPLEKAAPYAAEDADITLRLHQTLWPKLQAEEALKKVFEEIEMPLVPVLSYIERTGVLVDADMLHTQSNELAQRMAEIEQQAHNEAGETFNLSSPKQIQAIFYDKLGLPVLQKTPKGAPSTAEPVLQELALDYPLPKLILEHRSMSKLKSTYTDKLPLQINSKTGRVHTSYHQAVAATGRLSSSDPNLQNIPIRSKEGRRIRQAFIAPEGYKLLAADYSQIELRIMAHLSDDEGLLTAFQQGKDVHSATAAEIFNVPLDQVDSNQRRSAKAINFGLIYGMSAFGLAKQLGIARGAAQEYVDLYFERYPGVKEFMDRMRAEAHEHGYVETIFGRRLYLPDISNRNAQRRQYAERAAINAPMQGTAADIIKRAMICCHEWLQQSPLDARMIMQVHDELVFEIKEEHVEEAKQEIEKCMSNAADLKVPLVVDTGTGINWDEAH